MAFKKLVLVSSLTGCSKAKETSDGSVQKQKLTRDVKEVRHKRQCVGVTINTAV